MLTLACSLKAALVACAALQCPASGAVCAQQLGSASDNGEDARLGYDINPGTGNLFLSHTDIELRPALAPVLAFQRYYNSQGNGVDVGLGLNWTHSFSWSISVVGFVASIRRDTGQVVEFTQNGGAWRAQSGEFGTLIGSSSGGFTYTTKYGTAYGFANTTTYDGRLLSITPADDTAITLLYSGTRLAKVSSGNVSLDFSYSGVHIAAIEDWNTQQYWRYQYDGSNDLRLVGFPNTDGTSYGETIYDYANVFVGGATFNVGSSSGQLTRVAVRQSAGTFVPVAYFSYENPILGATQVVHAASGFDGTNLLRPVFLSYSLFRCGVSTAIATYTPGFYTKTLTSQGTSSLNLQRLTSIASTGGSGAPGEFTNAAYSWDSSLRLTAFTNANGYIRALTSYDALGTPPPWSKPRGALSRGRRPLPTTPCSPARWQ